jgi:hypothetical protein
MKRNRNDIEGRSSAPCSPSSSTPETDAAEFPVMTWPKRDNPMVIRSTLARKLEKDRNHWRNEHDRVVREYQHRLMVIGTSVIEASSYPSNDKTQAPT